MPSATRSFSLDDQSAFAALSGDFNPLHVDPVAARRLVFGTPVVHGIHAILWGLETCWAPAEGRARLAVVTATFRQPIRIGDNATCEASAGAAGALRVSVKSGGRLALELECLFEDEPGDGGAAPSSWPAPARGPCAVLDMAEATRARGQTPLAYDPEAMASRFPRLCARLPAWQLAALLATSRLVGMDCPGMRGVLSSLKLRFRDEGAVPSHLDYRVVKADPRLSSLKLQVTAPGIEGELVALLRPDPVEQPKMERLAALVTRGELGGVRALVVGGTRGLGEVTAKLVAAGGGQVRLTYHLGAADAARVVDEIHRAAGEARSYACDVLERRADPGLLEGWTPTHLFYFPTPFISLNESTEFSPDLFRLYCRYYVEGFVWVLDAALAGAARDLAVFYPSSSALDEVLPKAAEYAAAKAAGETVCAHLQKLHPEMRFRAPRLPRMLTDRTASVLGAEVEGAAEVMLRELRQLARAR